MGTAAGEDGDGEDEEEDVDGVTRLVTAAHVGPAPVKPVVAILDVRIHARTLGIILSRGKNGDN